MKSRQLFFLTSCFLFFANKSYSQLTPIWKEEQFGYIDVKGKKIVPYKYSSCSSFSDSLGMVSRVDENYMSFYGYLNHLGEEVIPLKYNDAQDFHNGFALVVKDEQNLLIDKKGNEYKIDNLYFERGQYKENFVSEGLVLIKKDSRYGFSNLKNELVIPNEYDFIYPFSDGIAITSQNKKTCFLDKSGKKTITSYSDCGIRFSNGLLPVQDSLTQKWGVINVNFDTIIGFDYEDIGLFKNGLATFVKGNEKGFLNEKKEVLYKESYNTRFFPTKEGRIFVETYKENLLTLYDESFHEIKQFKNARIVQNPGFQYGLCLLVFDNKTADKNERYSAYINREGEIVWQNNID
ncbi:MAG: WG repeat-containing protein [Bacteroidota bacterium]